jgi:outer membrane protein insertion porin family
LTRTRLALDRAVFVRPFGIALLTLAALFATGPAPARADIPASLEGRPIAVVETTSETPAGVTAETLGIPIGAPLDRALLRSVTQRLLASGEWAEVRFEAHASPAGAVLVAALVPRVLLTRVDLVGNQQISDDALLDAMRLREGSEVIGGHLEPIREALKELYRDRGYLAAEIDVELRATDVASRRVLRVQVRENEPTRIAAIVFDGDAPPHAAWSDELAEGADRVAGLGPLSALGLSRGDVLDQRRLGTSARAMEEHLRRDGYLEARVTDPTVQIDDAGATVTIALHLGRHYRVVVNGAHPLSRGDVEGVLELDHERLTRAVLTDIRERVVDLYRRHGFPEPRASVRRVRDIDLPEDRTAAVLEIGIDPGRLLRVVGLSFPGASHFGSDLLRDQVRSYLEEDLPGTAPFSPVDSEVVDALGLSGGRAIEARVVRAHHEDVPDSVYYEPTYDEAVAHIVELYEAAGFLSAEVGPAVLEELGDGRAIVTIPVIEGARTLVWDVGIRGNELVASSELLDAAQIARGSPFGHLALESARRRMVERYQSRGYLFARVEPRVHFSPDRERAEVLFEVVERFPVTVGEIRVVGADVTNEGVILERLSLRTGDLYTPERVRASEEALLALGIFSSVHIAPEDPDLAERTKPVIVTVSERTAQELGLSAGIGTGEGARGSLEYAYRNLFGSGVTFSLRLQLAYQFFFQDAELERAIAGGCDSAGNCTPGLTLIDRLERRLTVGLIVPHIPGAPDLRLTLDLVHLRDNFRDFGLDKNGLVLALAWHPLHIFNAALSGELEQNNVALFNAVDLQAFLATPQGMDPRNQRLLRIPQGQSAIAAARLSASLDLRDSPFTPTNGFFASATVEYARTLATERPEDLSNFMKIGLTLSGYVPIATGWVLALQLRGGRIYHLEPGSRTYPNRAYYLGGVDSMRGFLQDQVIPQDQADALLAAAARGMPIAAGAIVRTGDFFYLLRAELRFPIAGDVQGGVFADIGNVWADADAITPDQLIRLRYTAGLGLRLATPVGPIALDYGFNLSRNEALGEPFGAFHFSIGLF